MKVALIDLHYLPSIEYFCAIYPFEHVILEKHENFVKQSFRNRCYINTSQGIQMLIVPLTEKHGKVSIQNIKIDNRQKWQNNHWRAIESAYRKAPFFEFYSEEFKNIIYKGHDFLVSLNHDLLSYCLKSIQLKINLSETITFSIQPDSSLSDLRSQIIPKLSYSNRSFYHPIQYQQVFGSSFVANLSLLDLLFCEGPNTIRFLQTTKTI